MPDGVREDDPALVTAGARILVSVLESLQLLPVTVPEVRGAWLHMDVVHVTRATPPMAASRSEGSPTRHELLGGKCGSGAVKGFLSIRHSLAAIVG